VHCDVKKYKLVIGRNIQVLRRKAGLSQADLSDRCGIYRTYLSRIESGDANPSLIVLVALADSLGVKPESFFE
jgi:transcriptional regulator with XRE-family HTH domain